MSRGVRFRACPLLLWQFYCQVRFLNPRPKSMSGLNLTLVAQEACICPTGR